MELISIAVKNYRSITKTEKIPLSNLTVLLGPNNEGKSNILNAMMLGSQILSKRRLSRTSSRRELRLSYESYRGVRKYDWGRDFPLNLQTDDEIGTTELTFEIKLSNEEISEFKKEVGSNINGTLPVKISIDKAEHITFKVLKRGKGNENLQRNQVKIAEFISKKMDFYYIPAVRPAGVIQDQIEYMISENLEELYHNIEYLECIEKIKQLQNPIFEKISSEVKQSLQNFLPQVKDVKIDIQSGTKMSPFIRSSLKIDDGTVTEIQYKGDGIQSLTAISLINQVANKNSHKNIVLMIEEPEAHLHPNAIHQLNSILKNLSKSQQVIISTHSPLLVDSENIKNNIIVTNNKAKIAKDISEIRDILGVKAPDNLRSAELVLFVEGESDCRIVKKVLEYKSRHLKSAIASRKLLIHNIHGANKIDYLLSLYKDLHLTKVFFFADNDNAVKRSIDKLIAEKLIEENEYKYAIAKGLNESEIEDLFNFIYFDEFFDKFGVNLDANCFKKGKQK
jgi:predicted ATP-dependent endonuclease of OLD family